MEVTVMFANEPGLHTEKALSPGKSARTYRYQYIKEDPSCNTHAHNTSPRGEKLQLQRTKTNHQIGELQANRQPECPALPRRQTQCTEEGNNPSQEKNPRQKCSRNSDNSSWCRVAIRDVVGPHEASEKSDQADDDQHYAVYYEQGYYDRLPGWGLLSRYSQ